MCSPCSISDDDLCSSCSFCSYNPGGNSCCVLGFPGERDDDGYVVECDKIQEVANEGDNWVPRAEITVAHIPTGAVCSFLLHEQEGAVLRDGSWQLGWGALWLNGSALPSLELTFGKKSNHVVESVLCGMNYDSVTQGVIKDADKVVVATWEAKVTPLPPECSE